MVKKTKIGNCNILLVFRHRFEKNQSRFDPEFRRWEIGLWFKRSKIVGKKNFSKPEGWNKNLVNSYMLGIEFLLFKAWITWDFKGMHLEVND